jgi:uncharacterized protein YqjF (DUF2071 family)
MRLKEPVTDAARQRSALRKRRHRPYPLPQGPWVMGQSWERLLFAHWRVAPEALRRLIPRGLGLDLHNGEAWLGITPFRLRGLRPRGLPGVPGASMLLETNVRTYVVRDGKPGIYFFTLLATNRTAATLARLGYRLPYRLAEGAMACDGHETRYAIRLLDPGRGGQAGLRARYAGEGPAAPAAEGSLEHWLVERYCLYTQGRGGRPLRTDIHHRPWSIAPATGRVEVTGLAPALLEPLASEPLLHVAEQQDVLVWPPTAA